MKYSYYFGLFALIVIGATGVALSLISVHVFDTKFIKYESGSFKTTTMKPVQLSKAEIINSLGLLMHSSTEEELRQLANEAIKVRKEITTRLSENPADTLNYKAKVNGNNYYVHYQLVIPSALQQDEANHPNNEIHADYYYPNNNGTKEKYPVAIFLHDIQDNQDPERLISKLFAMRERLPFMGNGSAIILMSLPYYEYRSTTPGIPENEKQQAYFTSDPNKVLKNIQQSIADVHVLRDWLSQRTEIDQNKINLMGFSLGAIIGLINTTVNPVFQKNAFMLGGADISSVLLSEYGKERFPGNDMHRLGLTQESVRKTLAPLDAITWSANTRNKDFLVYNVSNDPLIRYEDSVAPIFKQLKIHNNLEMKVINGDSHRIRNKRNIFDMLKNVSDYLSH